MVVFRRFIIAVVDDDVRVLESLEELLESAGHSARPFPSAKRLLEANALSEIDCLIADIGMPAMDGFELQRVAKAAYPSLPVILITARHEVANQQRAAAQGCQGYFQKPFNAQALLAAVSKAIEESRLGE